MSLALPVFEETENDGVWGVEWRNEKEWETECERFATCARALLPSFSAQLTRPLFAVPAMKRLFISSFLSSSAILFMQALTFYLTLMILGNFEFGFWDWVAFYASSDLSIKICKFLEFGFCKVFLS